MNYYQCRNANRVIAGVTFTVTDIVCGSAWGVFQTDNPDVIKALDALCQDPKSAVTAITQEEYAAEMETQKKMNGWPILSESRTRPETVTSLKTPAGVVVEEHPEPPEDPDKPIEIEQNVTSVDEALSTAKLDPPPQTESSAEQPIKGKKKKG